MDDGKGESATRNVLEYLEEIVRQTPDKIAAACGEERYTFREMQALAKRIGAAIGKYGGKNLPIGVIAARSAETIAYLLGALYSGNYYVPMDPDMPAEKKQAIVDDTGLRIILGTEDCRGLAAALRFDGCYLSLNDLGPQECALPEAGGDDPLYMVYTSGSTGKPKGILKSHGAEISFIDAYCATFDFSAEDVIGNQTPFFFDASGKDLYLMLKMGCTLEILPTKLFSFPTELMEYMNDRRVTFISWVPTAISIVAQLNPFSVVKPEFLRKVFFVGEVMPMKYLNKWRRALPDLQYVNLYGQSELAGICCYFEVKGDWADTAVLPMGKPLKNSRMYLLDGGKTVTEPGRIGEMYIESPALALEYFHDPEKTAASFLIKDFGEGPVRCFKTGDMAQYDGEGNLIFAARTDFQIKHMGHRIELGEIEAIATALDEIKLCCCLYRPEKQWIYLFVEPADGCGLTGQEFRSLLRDKLSDYMLPRKVIPVEKMPLNANGKIDRQTLKTLMK
ncbi:MAG: amino acid adenylation domain-containing protein [Clostridia bacterium]|nr:amino acid adenylation domain-containing protein [Clostridia bacterium]